MTPAGRDKRAEFADLFAKSMRARVVMSPAFAHLTSSAKSVCFIVFIKVDNARHHKRKHDDGRPVITFSSAEAQTLLNISGVTHTAAMRQLIEHGFVDKIGHGGLLGANGTASTYAPSRRWMNWQPVGTKHNTTNIQKALKAKKAKKQRPAPKSKPQKGALQVVSRPELQPGSEIYFYVEGGTRARKGKLIEPIEDGWSIQGRREAGKFRAPVFQVPFARILTTNQLREKRRADENMRHRNRAVAHFNHMASKGAFAPTNKGAFANGTKCEPNH